MNPCFICKMSNSSNEVLFQHLSFIHGPQKVYKCGENNCGRAYGLFRSFKKHRKQVHPFDTINLNDFSEFNLDSENLDFDTDFENLTIESQHDENSAVPEDLLGNSECPDDDVDD